MVLISGVFKVYHIKIMRFSLVLSVLYKIVILALLFTYFYTIAQLIQGLRASQGRVLLIEVSIKGKMIEYG